MTTTVDPRQPHGVTVPIYRKSSSDMTPVAIAGGQVPRSDYADKANAGKTNS